MLYQLHMLHGNELEVSDSVSNLTARSRHIPLKLSSAGQETRRF
jgi:hypothetical protein